jgi:hypothetical protein
VLLGPASAQANKFVLSLVVYIPNDFAATEVDGVGVLLGVIEGVMLGDMLIDGVLVGVTVPAGGIDCVGVIELDTDIVGVFDGVAVAAGGIDGVTEFDTVIVGVFDGVNDGEPPRDAVGVFVGVAVAAGGIDDVTDGVAGTPPIQYAKPLPPLYKFDTSVLDNVLFHSPISSI